MYSVLIPNTGLSKEDSAALIAYARQKFAEERYPLSPTLQAVEDARANLDPKPEPMPLSPAKPHEPSRAEPSRA